jgi:hypothetical protein
LMLLQKPNPAYVFPHLLAIKKPLQSSGFSIS